MALQIQGNSGIIQEVGGTSFRAANIHVKPLEYGSLGHYRTAVRFSLIASQAANARLFEVRNSNATNLIIPTRLTLRWTQTAAHTAAILDSLDVYRLTNFTVSSTTNTVTPAASVRRISTMAAAPGSAVIRHVTVAGAAAGMTGFTSTKDANALHILPNWLLLAQPTAGHPKTQLGDVFDDVNGTHPFIMAQNEGFLIENRVALGAAAGSDVVVDFSWAEVAVF